MFLNQNYMLLMVLFLALNYKWLKKNDSFYSKTVKTFNMPAERSIDIDDKYQFIMAEALMK